MYLPPSRDSTRFGDRYLECGEVLKCYQHDQREAQGLRLQTALFCAVLCNRNISVRVVLIASTLNCGLVDRRRGRILAEPSISVESGWLE